MGPAELHPFAELLSRLCLSLQPAPAHQLRFGEQARELADGVWRTTRARPGRHLAALPPHTGPGDFPPSRNESSDRLSARHAPRTTGSSACVSRGLGRGHAALALMPSAVQSRSRPGRQSWRSARARPGNRCLARTPPLPPARNREEEPVGLRGWAAIPSS